MRCKVCERTFKITSSMHAGTKEIAREMHVCGSCQRKIRLRIVDYGSHSKTGKMIHCSECGKECVEAPSHDTCGWSGCRTKFYTKKTNCKIIDRYISGDNSLDNKALFMTIHHVRKLGYTITIVKTFVPNTEKIGVMIHCSECDIMCKKTTISHDTCGTESCRSKFYRKKDIRKVIDRYISDDIITNIRLNRVFVLGYTITIEKNKEVTPIVV